MGSENPVYISVYNNNFIKAYDCTLVITMSSEANAISKLKELLESNYEIEKIQPPVMASDAEVNIVIVTLLCPDGKRETIKAYRGSCYNEGIYKNPPIDLLLGYDLIFFLTYC
jgi:hypothetical protein